MDTLYYNSHVVVQRMLRCTELCNVDEQMSRLFDFSNLLFILRLMLEDTINNSELLMEASSYYLFE